MTRFLALYAATAVVLFALDFVWLRFVARDFYASQLGALLLPEPRLGIAAAFYLLYCAGIVWFAILPQLGGGLLAVALSGAFLGLIAYGTYDITNLATIRGFPATVAVVDMAWGTALTAVSAAGGAFIATRWFGVTAA